MTGKAGGRISSGRGVGFHREAEHGASGRADPGRPAARPRCAAWCRMARPAARGGMNRRSGRSACALRVRREKAARREKSLASGTAVRLIDAMPYVLHNRLGSGGFAVQAALTAAGIPFELALLDSAPGTPLPESFAAVNPWRQVPVLVTPEGEVLTETAAILIYLVGRHPER